MSRRIPPRDFGSIQVKTPLAFPGQRIGVMGGTFNPPHAGHAIVAETAVKRLGLDQLWWVVTPGNPLKSNGQLPSQNERMAACRKFARGPKMKITGFEAELGTPYTAATLAFLRRRHPRVNFVWVMGADNLVSFHRWQRWQEIAETFPIAVIDRPGWRLRGLSSRFSHHYAHTRWNETDSRGFAESGAPAWVFCTSRLSGLSSTELRARRANAVRDE